MPNSFSGQKPKWKVRDVFYILAAVILLSLFSKYIVEIFDDNFSRFIVASLMQAGILIFGVFLFALTRGSRFKDLGLTTRNLFSNVIKGIVGGISLLLLIVVVGIIMQLIFPQTPEPQPFENIVRQAQGVRNLVIIFLAGSVLAPLSEELFFRGFIYPLIRFRWGIWPGIIITSLFFGSMHFDLFRMIPLTFGGIGLAWLYEKSGSLITPMVAHAVWNTIMTLLIFVSLSQ